MDVLQHGVSVGGIDEHEQLAVQTLDGFGIFEGRTTDYDRHKMTILAQRRVGRTEMILLIVRDMQSQYVRTNQSHRYQVRRLLRERKKGGPKR